MPNIEQIESQAGRHESQDSLNLGNAGIDMSQLSEISRAYRSQGANSLPDMQLAFGEGTRGCAVTDWRCLTKATKISA